MKRIDEQQKREYEGAVCNTFVKRLPHYTIDCMQTTLKNGKKVCQIDVIPNGIYDSDEDGLTKMLLGVDAYFGDDVNAANLKYKEFVNKYGKEN